MYYMRKDHKWKENKLESRNQKEARNKRQIPFITLEVKRQHFGNKTYVLESSMNWK